MQKRFYEFVEKIVYINLDSRLDRRKEIENEFKRVGVPEDKIIRFSAIPNNWGAVGCSMSHIAVVKMAIENKWDNIFIMEDDFNFIENTDVVDTAFNHFFSKFNKENWDAVNLSRGTNTKLIDIDDKFVGKAHFVSTASGYIVNNSLYQRLLQNYEEGLQKLLEIRIEQIYALDVYTHSLHLSSNWFVFNPSLGYQRESYSDLIRRNANYVDCDRTLKFKDKHVSVHIMGGLGNQMFQVAAIYGIGFESNLDPIVEKIPESFSKRAVYWDSVMHKVNYVNTEKIKSIKFDYLIRENSPAYQYDIISQNKSYLLYGYFQSPLYFQKHRDKILDLFSLPDNMQKIVSDAYHKLKTKLSEPNEDINLVSVHVRRGDYLNIQHVHPVQDMKYFSAGMDKIRNLSNKKSKFVVFSEDMEWCKANFVDEDDVYFMDYTDFQLDKTQIPFEVFDMYLMSMMDHFIIANSSFSWWGAWLSKNKDKIVIAPSRWFTDDNMNNAIKTIFYENCITI